MIATNSTREKVLGEVIAERIRQQALWGDQWNPGVTDPGVKLAILMEEVGEVAKELLERGESRALRTELIQVAAVAVAWAESLEGVPNYHLGGGE